MVNLRRQILIDPVIFSFELFGRTFSLYWYGLIIALSVMIGAIIAEREITRRSGPAGHIWDLLIWVVPSGIAGARLWYVLNDIAGGSTYYSDEPGRIFRIWEGGLHIYGAVLGGLIAAYYYTRRHNLDLWLLMDALAPTLLIAQGFGRIANFINQELYGPPTDLPWGVKIAEQNRLFPWTDIVEFPVETTRFHPTFFYESIWNILMAVLILWLVRRFASQLLPGAAFYMWMIAEGVGRVWLEFFRPDQPTIPGTGLSYSRLIAILLALFGTLLLLNRQGKINLRFIKPGPETYKHKDLKWKKK
jgi:phosphatidylglycerol:prolipoprotein diacylglycerol transferase